MPRCSHSSFVNGNQIIVFGGFGNKFEFQKNLQVAMLEFGENN
jgi:hypothetical protein